MQILNYNSANKHKSAIDVLSLEIRAQQCSDLQHVHHAAAIAVPSFLWREEEEMNIQQLF